MIYVLELDYYVELNNDAIIEENDIVDIIYESDTIKDCAEFIESLPGARNVSEDIEAYIRVNGVYIFNNSNNCAINMNYNYNTKVEEDSQFVLVNNLKNSRFKLLTNSGRNSSIYKSLKVFIRNKKINEIGIS
jgi:hypothetical protein